MRPALGWLVGGVLYVLMAAGVVAQPICDLADRLAFPPISEEAFYQLPNGAVALGERCNTSSKTCRSYVDVSSCSEIIYPLVHSGSANKVFVAVNSMSACLEECEHANTFLAASLVFQHHDDTIGPFADMTRNFSSQWGYYRYSARAQRKCCDRLIKPEDFLTGQSEAASIDDFVRISNEYWHSAFEVIAGFDIETWEFRSFFTERLAKCGNCSIKAFLLKFRETPSIDMDRPSSPLLFSAKVMNFPGVRLQTMAPTGDDAYDLDVGITFVR